MATPRPWFHLQLVDSVAGNSASAYLHVGDVDAWRTAMVDACPDAAISAADDMPWGMREYSVTDPFGNAIRIGQAQ